MADIHQKRKKIEDRINTVLSLMDPTGINAKKYRNMFQVMTDDDFSKWIKAFLADDKSNIRVDIEEFGKRTMKYENIEKAANAIGVDLFEYVYLPHVSSNKDHPIRTKQPVLVGWLNVKRTQQLVSKKTGLALSDNNRDDVTGALKNDSKGGTTTGIENEVLAGVGATEVISEINGARADNMVEYDNMLTKIAETGSVSLADIKTNVYDKPTVLVADLYFAAMGIKTDLVSESYISAGTVKRAVDSR